MWICERCRQSQSRMSVVHHAIQKSQGRFRVANICASCVDVSERQESTRTILRVALGFAGLSVLFTVVSCGLLTLMQPQFVPKNLFRYLSVERPSHKETSLRHGA